MSNELPMSGRAARNSSGRALESERRWEVVSPPRAPLTERYGFGVSFDHAMESFRNNTWDGAFGVEYLFNLEHQLVLEIAALQTTGDITERFAQDDQYGLGIRCEPVCPRGTASDRIRAGSPRIGMESRALRCGRELTFRARLSAGAMHGLSRRTSRIVLQGTRL